MGAASHPIREAVMDFANHLAMSLAGAAALLVVGWLAIVIVGEW